MTTLEGILVMLEAVLANAIAPATIIRNAERPAEVPAEGLVILRDGSVVEAEALLSPLQYLITHDAELWIATEAQATRDAILQGVVEACASDRTLGDLVMWLEPQAPERDVAEAEGANAPGVVMVPLRFIYQAGSMAA